MTALLHYIASALAIRKKGKSACAFLFLKKKSLIKPGRGDREGWEGGREGGRGGCDDLHDFLVR